MDQPTLGDLFTKHLGFPSHKGAKLTAEAFAERLEERAHGFGAPDQVDPLEWVEHFFEMEHPLEERERELTQLADRFHTKEPVLEFSLGSEEFVVIENDDEVVVVSDGGSLVLSRTEELTRALRQAQLPQGQQYTPGQAFKPAGEKAYHVTQGGQVSALDVKAIAAALKSAPVRVEPVATVAHAASRLQAFAPVERVRPAEGRPSEPQRASAFQRMAPVVKVVQAEARKETKPQVVIVERGQAKEQSGSQARFWQRLAGGLTGSGRGAERAVHGPAGTSAVALGRQTFAVKVGGVTALVQRPVASIASRLQGAEARAQSHIERRTQGAPLSRWMRGAIDERAQAGGYWIQPSARTGRGGAEARPAWVDAALSQARQARERARLDISVGRGAEQLSARTEAKASQLSAPALSPAAARALQPGTSASVEDFVLPRFRVSDTGGVDYVGPMSYAGALPATTLRALYTGLERTAALEGHHLPRVTVDLDPTRAAPSPFLSGSIERSGFQGGRPELSGFSVRSMELETEPAVLPSVESSAQASASAAPAAAGESIRTQIITVPVAVEGAIGLAAQPSEPMARMAAAAESSAARISDAAASVAGSPAELVREPSARLLQNVFTLPFAGGSNVRVGRELSAELEHVLSRSWSEPSASATALSSVQLPVSAVEQARLDVQSLGSAQRSLGTLPSAPAAAAVPGPATALGEVSSRVWLDWALSNAPYAYMKKAGEPVAGPAQGASELSADVHAHLHVVTTPGAPPPAAPPPTSGAALPPLSGQALVPAAPPPPGPSDGPLEHRAARPISSPRGLALAPLSLAAVNDRRLPAHEAHAGPGLPAMHDGPTAEGLEEFVVPQPLFVQMGAVPPAAPPPPAAAPRSKPLGAVVEVHHEGQRSVIEHREVAPPAPRSEPRAARLDMTVTRTAAASAVPPPAAPPPPAAAPGSNRLGAVGEVRHEGQRSVVEHREVAAPAQGASQRTMQAPAPAAPPPPASSAHAPQGHAASVPPPAPPPPARVEPAFSRDLGAARMQESGGLNGALGARAFAQGNDVHAGLPPMQVQGHEAVHVVQQSAGMSEVAAETLSASGSPVRRKGKDEGSARMEAGSSNRTGLPDQLKSGVENLSGHSMDNVKVHYNSEKPAQLNAHAYAQGTDIHLGPGQERHVAHESWHVVQQRQGRVSAGGMPAGTPYLKAKGSSLRFRFPSMARWWTDAVGRGGQAGAGAAGSFAMASGAGAAEVVKASGGVSAGDPLPTLGSKARGALPQLPGAGGLSAPAALARSSGRAGVSSTSGSSYAGGGAGAFVQPNADGQLSAHSGEMAYVAIGSSGEAAVVGPQAAAALKRSQKERGSSVDMTVVAAIAPQAPSVEEMALAGHERPHAKGKKEGGAKAGGGVAKNDSLSLQGTVDSLAQRIYHRLKRRLQSDRERFGG